VVPAQDAADGELRDRRKLTNYLLMVLERHAVEVAKVQAALDRVAERVRREGPNDGRFRWPPNGEGGSADQHRKHRHDLLNLCDEHRFTHGRGTPTRRHAIHAEGHALRVQLGRDPVSTCIPIDHGRLEAVLLQSLQCLDGIRRAHHVTVGITNRDDESICESRITLQDKDGCTVERH